MAQPQAFRQVLDNFRIEMRVIENFWSLMRFKIVGDIIDDYEVVER